MRHAARKGAARRHRDSRRGGGPGGLSGCQSVPRRHPRPAPPDSFAQTNLIANKASFGAKLTDPNLTNAWGLAAQPARPSGSPTTTPVSRPSTAGCRAMGKSRWTSPFRCPAATRPGRSSTPTPRPSTSAQAGSSAHFIVDTDSVGKSQSPGEIAAWNGGASFVVEDSAKGGPGGKTPAHAVFKGLALATRPAVGPELFAADVANAKIDVFNKNFQLLRTVTEFRDPGSRQATPPSTCKAWTAAVRHLRQAEQGQDRRGRRGRPWLRRRIHGHRHAYPSPRQPWPAGRPWGLAIAPAGFGPFAGDLLVGNLGNGWINVWNPVTGRYHGWLATTSGKPVAINGLWGLQVGNSAFGGASSVVFSAGPNGYGNGLVGVLNPAQPVSGR